MMTVALTGGIGSGKTEVSRFFEQLGVAVIDTDVISKQLVVPDSTALKKIIDRFGESYLLADGNLDRKKMRDLIFSDIKARQALENILHPLIYKEVRRQLEEQMDAYSMIVVPLLAETGQQYQADRVLLVDSPEALQRERVKSRDNINDASFEQIAKNQASRQQRQSIADDILLNDADLESLHDKIRQLHHKYLQLAPGFQAS